METLVGRVDPVASMEDAQEPLDDETKQLTARVDPLVPELEKQAEKSVLAIKTLIAYASVQIRMGNYRQAEGVYRAVLKIDPENVHARRGLGIALQYLAKYDEAEEIYRRLLKRSQSVLDPNDPEVAIDLNLSLIHI